MSYVMTLGSPAGSGVYDDANNIIIQHCAFRNYDQSYSGLLLRPRYNDVHDVIIRDNDLRDGGRHVIAAYVCSLGACNYEDGNPGYNRNVLIQNNTITRDIHFNYSTGSVVCIRNKAANITIEGNTIDNGLGFGSSISVESIDTDKGYYPTNITIRDNYIKSVSNLEILFDYSNKWWTFQGTIL